MSWDHLYYQPRKHVCVCNYCNTLVVECYNTHQTWAWEIIIKCTYKRFLKVNPTQADLSGKKPKDKRFEMWKFKRFISKIKVYIR